MVDTSEFSPAITVSRDTKTTITMSSARKIHYRLKSVIWSGLMWSMGLLLLTMFTQALLGQLATVVFGFLYAAVIGFLLLLMLYGISSFLYPRSRVSLYANHLEALQGRIPFSSIQKLSVASTKRGATLLLDTPTNTIAIARHRDREPLEDMLYIIAQSDALALVGTMNHTARWRRSDAAKPAEIFVDSRDLVKQQDTVGEQVFLLKAALDLRGSITMLTLWVSLGLLIFVPVQAAISLASCAGGWVLAQLMLRLWLRIAPAQRVVLSQQTVQTKREAVPLESIQSVSIRPGMLGRQLWAHTANGEHRLAVHPDEGALLAMQLPIEARARALRATRQDAGVAVDDAPAVPEALRALQNQGP